MAGTRTLRNAAPASSPAGKGKAVARPTRKSTRKAAPAAHNGKAVATRPTRKSTRVVPAPRRRSSSTTTSSASASASRDVAPAPPPPTPASVLSRALSERMFLLSRLPLNAEHAPFLVSGQSGKVYTVHVPVCQSSAPRCNCVDHIIRKRVCKHILFVLLRVLKLAASLPQVITPGSISAVHAAIASSVSGPAPAPVDADAAAPDAVRRAFELLVPEHLPRDAPPEPVECKPVEHGDECPICFEDLPFDAVKKEEHTHMHSHVKKEEDLMECEADADKILHCLLGCGKAVHDACMRRYAASAADGCKCPLCRADWVFPEQRSETLAGMRAHIDESHRRLVSRGLLNNNRLVDLSALAPASFVGTAASSRQPFTQGDDNEYTPHDDGADEVLDRARGESSSERAERQRDQRAERARNRGAQLPPIAPASRTRTKKSAASSTKKKDSTSPPPRRSGRR